MTTNYKSTSRIIFPFPTITSTCTSSKLGWLLTVTKPKYCFTNKSLMTPMMTVGVSPLMILSNNVIVWSDYFIIPIMCIIPYFSAIAQLISKDKHMWVKQPSRSCVKLCHPIKSSLIERCCIITWIAMNLWCAAPISPNFSNIIIIFWDFGIIRRNTWDYRAIFGS